MKERDMDLYMIGVRAGLILYGPKNAPPPLKPTEQEVWEDWKEAKGDSL